MIFLALTLIKYVLPQDTFSNEMKVESVVATLLATSEPEVVTMYCIIGGKVLLSGTCKN